MNLLKDRESLLVQDVVTKLKVEKETLVRSAGVAAVDFFFVRGAPGVLVPSETSLARCGRTLAVTAEHTAKAEELRPSCRSARLLT